MNKRRFWRRGVLLVSCLAVLTVWAQTGRPQPPPVPMPPPLGGGPSAPGVPSRDFPAIPSEVLVPDSVKTPTRPVPAPTVDDLIAQLEKLRKQKADLEKQEKDLVVKLQERMKEQVDRLGKLGILPPAILPQVPPPIISAPPPPLSKDTVDAFTPLLKNAGGRDTEKK